MTSMETIELRPGYRISRVLKGGWQLSDGHSRFDRQAAIDDMGAYVRAGITTFDCADIYTGVEQAIGDFRRHMIATGQKALLAPLKVHTKYVPDLTHLATMTRRDTEAIIDRSLTRLGLERLDLVQFHWWNLAVARYVEVAGWLKDLQAKGKIDLIGTTNFNTHCMRELLDAGIPVASMQMQYSVLDTRAEKSLVALCRQHNVNILCYGTVAGGFLGDRWLGKLEPDDNLENRSLTKYKLIIDDIGGWDLFQAVLRTLRKVADRHGVSITDVATRYMLDRPQVAGIIVGVRHGGHLESHAKLMNLKLTEQDRADITAIMAQRRDLEGDFYDLERDLEGRHGRIMHYNNNAKPAA